MFLFSLHSTKATAEAHSRVSQVWSRPSTELFSTGGRLDADPGDQVAPARLGAAPRRTAPLLSSLSSSACWLFTRETMRLDQMGSVTRCYYGTDRVHFSSWPYQREGQRDLRVWRRCRLKIVGTRCEMSAGQRRCALYVRDISVRSLAATQSMLCFDCNCTSAQCS